MGVLLSELCVYKWLEALGGHGRQAQGKERQRQNIAERPQRGVPLLPSGKGLSKWEAGNDAKGKKRDESGVYQAVQGHGGKGRARAKGEHGGKQLCRLAHVRRPEQHEGKTHGQHGVDMQNRPAPGPCLQPFHGYDVQGLQGGEQTVPRAPQEKGKGRAVPEAAEGEHDKFVEGGPGFPLTAAAQGDVEIIPEPAGKGDVPAAPEAADAAGRVRPKEVFRRGKAKHLPQTDGHVAVSGEIQKDLERVGQGGEPGKRRADVGPFHCENPVHRARQGVGKQELFAKADDESPKAQRHLLRIHASVGELGGKAVKAGDGAGQDLGKEGDIEQQVKEACRRLRRGSVGIHKTGDALEGEETDAQQTPREKAQVFVNAEEGQIRGHGGGKRNLAPFGAPDGKADHKAENIV